MKCRLILMLSLTFIVQIIYAQGTCDCEDARIQISAHMSNGQTIGVYGYEEKRLSKYKYVLSEINFCNCKTKRNLLFIGATRTAEVEYKDGQLIITELIDFPIGENNSLVAIPFARKIFYSNDYRISQTPFRIVFNPHKYDMVDSQIIDFAKNASNDEIGSNFEIVLRQLALISMQGNTDAQEVLNEFGEKRYEIVDGALAEELTKVLNLVKWFVIE